MYTMSQAVALKEFDWVEELNQTFIKSLTTTFGLDFMLLEDKTGGDVDTVHNVRQGIYATEQEKQRYENRGEYNSAENHTHPNYIKRGQNDKSAQQQGELYDPYRDAMFSPGESRNLDHIISAHEIHDDPGRVLAEIGGTDIANMDFNLSSTTETINKSKKDLSTQEFLNKLPEKIETKKQDIASKKKKLESMPANTPEERQKKRQLADEIRKGEERIKELESIDSEAMLEADRKARELYDQEINIAYYTSSKFLKNTSIAALNQGVRMGARQALGIVLAEVWFELKEQLPKIYEQCKENFDLQKFLAKIGKTIANIWQRVKRRFSDLLESFKDGAIGGIFSSLSTTVMNIFMTSTKLIGKLIRETWNSLVQAAKLLFFNPDSLPPGDLLREVLKILSFAAATFAGTMIHHQLAALSSIPFGDLLASFLSAFATGLMTVGMTFVLEHSTLMKKVWEFLNNLKSKYEKILEHYQEINAELDRYLLELAKVEFNLNTAELSVFSDELKAANDEEQRRIVLHKEIARRNIKLPFESGDSDSVRAWLMSKASPAS